MSIAAILGAIVASLGTAFYLKKSATATASASPSASPRLTVRPTPKDATIMLDGKEAIAADTPFTCGLATRRKRSVPTVFPFTARRA